ncbi:hypothetical protein [Eggerthella sinensis]|nr:hypothetical protein [Eggerthella sinensis]MCB7039036.1 hypothetical protein [Eggerthella sinensis]
MKGFLKRLQLRMPGAVQGRRGADDMAVAFAVIGIVLLFGSLIPGFDLLS